MKQKTKQTACLALAVAFFVAFNASVFVLFTRRCLPDSSEGMQAKSIELDRYLPFVEDSEIVKRQATLPLTGELPVIDSAAALYPVCSAFVNAVYPKEAVSFDGTDFTADSRLQMRNTRAAYQAVVDGTADIIVCAPPSAEQLQYAADCGVELALVPIGCEAFVFLVNAKNPVDNLTVQQIRGIYSGAYSHWSQLGGERLPILPLQRNAGSGSQTAFLSFMGDTPAKKNPLGVAGSAIGFSFRYYVEDVVDKGGVKMLAIDGVYPDKAGVSGGGYPLVSPFYAVYNAANDSPNIPILLDWFLSDTGQEIIEQTGYLPLS